MAKKVRRFMILPSSSLGHLANELHLDIRHRLTIHLAID
jgi:hypothetical protein